MSARHGAVAAAVMAKMPVPGDVKTRLSPPLSLEEAAELYRCFLLDRIEQVRSLGSGVHPALAFTPATARADFQAIAPGFTLVEQRGLDLGARLNDGLASLLGEGFPAALAVDSDSPTLPTAFLVDAVARLVRPGGPDVVLGPTRDGGYYLIGLRAPRPDLFCDMPWSTAGVLEETLRRAGTGGLIVETLPAWFDVDTPADLERLRRSLGGREEGCAHTRRFFLREPDRASRRS